MRGPASPKGDSFLSRTALKPLQPWIILPPSDLRNVGRFLIIGGGRGGIRFGEQSRLQREQPGNVVGIVIPLLHEREKQVIETAAADHDGGGAETRAGCATSQVPVLPPAEPEPAGKIAFEPTTIITPPAQRRRQHDRAEHGADEDAQCRDGHSRINRAEEQVSDQ